MAIDRGTVSKTLTVKERTKQIAIFTPLGQDPEICIYRERVEISEDGTTDKTNDLPCIEVKASQISTIEFSKMTGAQLYAIIQAWADGLATAKAESTGPFVAMEVAQS